MAITIQLDKCVTLQSGFDNLERDNFMEIGENQGRKTILTVTQEKDIGVTFDKDLKFRSHISKVLCKQS